MNFSLLARTVIVSCVLVFLAEAASTADSAQLLEAYGRMSRPAFDTTEAYDITGLVIEHKDLKLVLDSGTFYPFEPVDLDSQPIVWGGYFVGKGQIEFTPTVAMEKEQLRRAYDADSLVGSLTTAELIFETSEFEQIRSASTRITPQMSTRTQQAFELAHSLIVINAYGDHVFQALKAIAQPAGQPFLLINADLGAAGQTIYEFNPYSREEVNLLHHRWQTAASRGEELVCSYSQYIDPSYININGMDKSQLLPKQYTISVDIDNLGTINADAALQVDITKPVQMATFALKPGLVVDSVLDSTGARILFLRSNLDSSRSSMLHLIFDRRLGTGQTLSTQFYYHGNLADKSISDLYINAGPGWYPTYGYNQPVTFDMTFRTPKAYDFVASGRQIESRQSGDRLVTHLQQTRPSIGVSFSLGRRDKYDSREEGAPPVEVHYSRTMHNDFADALSHQYVISDSNVVEQTATDVINSARLFNYYFGPCIQPKLAVTEIPQLSPSDFPGLVQLDFSSWSSFEDYPDARLQRAVGVARQWWGNAVAGATPHDRWLSEGFAQYSALMFLQHVTDNDTFALKLDQCRDQIFAAGDELKPLALMTGHLADEQQQSTDVVMSKKGAFVLHMIRNLLIDLNTMSEDRFLSMMREWYSTGKSRPMTTLDLKQLVEKHAGVDMGWFFDEWVYGSGLPTYRFTYTTERDNQGRAIVTCHLEQQGVPDGFKMYIPLEIQFASGSRQYLRLLVDRPVVDLRLPPIEGPVRRLFLNPFNSVLARVTQ